MRKNAVIVGAVLGLIALVWLMVQYTGTSASATSVQPQLHGEQQNNMAVVETPAQPLTIEYKNTSYRFSVMMPDGFTAQQLPQDESGRATILLQNAKGDGIQILISKDDSHQTMLTADDVRGSIPDMKVNDEQSVEIGSGNTGVAFKSDNEAFQGNSREVWFYFRGNLYQISTYAHLDPLLKSMFGTWKFF